MKLSLFDGLGNIDSPLSFEINDGMNKIDTEPILTSGDNDLIAAIVNSLLPPDLDDLEGNNSAATCRDDVLINLDENLDPDLDELFSLVSSLDASAPDSNRVAQELTTNASNEIVSSPIVGDDNHDPIKESPNIIVKSTDVVEPPNFLNDSSQERIQIHVNNPICLGIQPSPNHHVRYETDVKTSLRYTKAADDKPMKINLSCELSEMWNLCQKNGYIPWIRITRTTVGNPNNICHHPYPIWMKSSKAKVYDGSIYIHITEDDISRGYIEIENLVLITLKQDKLATMNRFAIYDPSKTVFVESCHTYSTNAKSMIEQFRLHQSKLHFQIMITSPNNILYPTNCCCETITLTQYTGNKLKQSSSAIDEQLSTENPSTSHQLVEQTPSPTSKHKIKENQVDTDVIFFGKQIRPYLSIKQIQVVNQYVQFNDALLIL